MLTSEDLRFFSVVAASPSLAAASRTLNVTASAVTQRLGHLERRLAVRLVERSGRRLALTDEGELLAGRALVILRELDETDEVLAARRDVVAGRLRVVATFGFGRRYVAPLVARFREAYPAVTPDLTLTDHARRVPERAWDILVSVGELRDTAFVGRRLAPNERLLCAAPAYLARHGTPERPEDLRTLDNLAVRENDEDVTLWRFRRDGTTTTVRVDPPMASNDGGVVRDWAIAGLGLIVRSEWDVVEDLKAGRLVRVLPAYRLPPADIVALVGTRYGRSARTQAFLDLLVEAFAPPPWR